MPIYSLKTNKLPKSEVEIHVEIGAESLDRSRSKAVAKLSGSLNLDGFRKGKIPEEVVVKTVGEDKVLEEAAEITINENYPEILKELKFDTLGRPEISITKLSFGNPLSFKIKVAILPEFKLPDYMDVAKKSSSLPEERVNVNETEVEEVLLQIRKNKAHSDWHSSNPDEKDHSKHPDFDDDKNLPILNDEFAKIAGNFKDVSELREKVKQNIIEDKKIKNIEKRRALIMEELVKNTEMELPEILISSEVEKSVAQIKDDMVRIGGSFQDYLVHIKKTEEDLRQDLRADSEKKAKIQLIFNKIAEKEKIEPSREIVEAEVKNLLDLYPGANKDSARIYVATQLMNREVLKLLEQK